MKNKTHKGFLKIISSQINLLWRFAQTSDVRGVAVSGRVHEWINSSKLTASRILGIRNTAVRRICLEEMGYERFLAQVKHTVIFREGDYEFLKIDRHKIEEPICLIRVRCPSTRVFYVLRVPPTVKTIKEAIAWTFGLGETEYNPLIET